MSNEEKSNAGITLLTFILGAASGAAVALLYAPATGRDTREYLSERARQGRDQAASAAGKARDLVEQGRQSVNTAVEQGRQTMEQGRQAIEHGKQTLASAFEQGREAYQQAKSRDLT